MPNLSHLKIANAPAAFADFAQKHNEVVALIESIEAATGLDIKITHNPGKKLKVGNTPDQRGGRPRGRIRIGIKSGGILGQVGGFGGTGGGGGNVANTLLYNDGAVAISIDGTNGVLLQQTGGGTAQFSTSGQIYSSSNSGTSQFLYTPNTATLSVRNGSRYTNVTNVGITHTDGTNTINVTTTAVTAASSSVFSSSLGPVGLTIASNSNGSALFSAITTTILGSNGTGISMDKDSFVLNGGPGGSFQLDRSLLTHNMSIKTINVCNGNVAMSMLVLASDPF